MSVPPEQQSLLEQLPVPTDSTTELPFETSELRRLLEEFLKRKIPHPETGASVRLGSLWGIYSFYDYEEEPIYVGQTTESLGTRIRRHLTNQRTDAVAMNVLDPFEVYKIVVYPLPKAKKSEDMQMILDALEHKVYSQAITQSKFNAILNEKEPPTPKVKVRLPHSHDGVIVSDDVRRIREHPDIRIARRTQTISRLAQVISERKVKRGLRNVLLVQARRLEWLARRRLELSADVSDEDAD